jgi:dTDP-4-dehydrorhamnose reductase
MTKILILGSGGMLGNYVSTYFNRIGTYDVTSFNRNQFDVLIHPVQDLKVSNYDVVINCIGVIKPLVNKIGTLNTTVINSVFPHLLANECKTHNVKLIHITTDCVFSGKTGFYLETSDHDALDVYGKTKSLGEPDNAMVIRTSIIGEEVNSNRSLIEWVKSNHRKTVDGYTNHTWNGLTCLEVAKFIERCLRDDIYWEGVRHIFNTTPTTKKELVELIAVTFNIDLTIISRETTPPVYRTLSTIYTPLIATSIKQQLKESAGFWIEK